MKGYLAGLATTCLLLPGCSRISGEEGLTGRWVESSTPYTSLYDLRLEPDRTFSTTVLELALSCRMPENISDTRATGRWSFDPDTHRISLDYDAPALAKCRLSDVHSLVVDPSGGQTDLLIEPGDGDPDKRIRLMRPRRVPPPSAASLAKNQVACFRAHGEWGRHCLEPKEVCYTKFRDAGKACTDSSQCEGLCLVDMVIDCQKGKECDHPPFPRAGQPFVGICQRTNESCGSFIEIHKGRAEPGWSVD